MPMQEIDDVTALLDEMKQYLSYDPETGDFTWIKTQGTSKTGKIAGSLHGNGYIIISFNSNGYRTHRLAWLFTHGKWPNNFIDHVDGNRSNNKINNLRDVTDQENKFNIKKVNAKSGYRGAYKTKCGKWEAKISLNGKLIHLGTFDTSELANEAYQAAKLKYHVIGDANFNQENFINRKPIVRKISKSGYRGVTETKDGKWKWMAKISLNGKTIYLGRFETPELASEAYQAAKLKYHVIGNANES